MPGLVWLELTLPMVSVLTTLVSLIVAVILADKVVVFMRRGVGSLGTCDETQIELRYKLSILNSAVI